MGTWDVEISVQVETQVTVEYDDSGYESGGTREEYSQRMGLKDKLEFARYDPEARGLLGPRDQPRRRVFSPAKRV